MSKDISRLRPTKFLTAASLAFLMNLSYALEAQAAALDVNLGLSAKAEVTAGIDPDTRAFIEGLPDAVKKKFIEALSEALPMIDKSVDSYLDKLNEILTEQEYNIGCTLKGAIPTVPDLLKLTPHPARDVADQAKRLETSFHGSSAPAEYVVAYADLVHMAGASACKARSISEGDYDLMVLTVQPYEADAHLRWSIWRRVGANCVDADTCYDFVRRTVEASVEQADERDRSAFKARDAMASIDKPTPPGLFERFRQKPYEDAMIHLYRVSDGILISKAIRYDKAETEVDGVKSELDKQQELFSKITTDHDKYLQNVLCHQCQQDSIDLANSAVKTFDAQSPALADAQGTYAGIADYAKVQTDRIAQLRRQAQDIVNSANNNFKVEAADDERKKREAAMAISERHYREMFDRNSANK